MARKYFRSSIESLEAIFKEKNDSLEILKELKEELTHRKTKRAKRLRDQVNERLMALRARSAPEERSSQGTLYSAPYQPQSEPAAQNESPQFFTQPLDAKAAPARKTSKAGERTASSPMPQITDRPEEILSAWTALEVPSPQSYVRPEDLAGGDTTRVAKINGLPLPWERGEKARPNTRLYYQIVLGSVDTYGREPVGIYYSVRLPTCLDKTPCFIPPGDRGIYFLG